ncbi:MAG: hypothetical protein WAO69_15765 [Aestuariivita sp.]
MEFDFDPAEVSAVGAVINSDLMHAMMIIGAIAVFGLLGRLFFMAMRDRAAKHNPLRDASGGGLIFASLALVAAGIYFNSGHVKTMVMVQRHVVDPITVSVLKRDSCQLSGGDYCVVVFQEDREIVVNWFDKRVHMFTLLTPAMNPPWGSPRPVARDPHYLLTQADASEDQDIEG